MQNSEILKSDILICTCSVSQAVVSDNSIDVYESMIDMRASMTSESTFALIVGSQDGSADP